MVTSIRKNIIRVAVYAIMCLGFISVFGSQTLAQSDDEKTIAAIFNERLNSGEMYHLLGDLCKNIGPRLSGSEGAERAVIWAKEVMESYDFDNVYLQEVLVPHWERGNKEQVRIVDIAEGMVELNALALGGSVPTDPIGLTGQVVVVNSLEEVEELGRELIEGKIVFYNRKMIYSKLIHHL